MNSIIKMLAMMLSAGVLVIGLGVAATQWLKPAQAGLSPSDSAAASAASATAAQTGQSMTVTEASGMSQAEEVQMRQQSLQHWLQQHLTEFKQQSGNLEAFLQAWTAQCQAANCDALLRAALASHIDQAFANKMLRLLNSLPAYEAAMQSVVMSTATDPRQRYAKIWQLREQMLGQEGAVLAFGQEKAFATYQFQFADLKARAANLSTEQRLAELKQLQQQTLGPYGDTVRQAEGNAGDYEKALQLMLVGVTDPAAQAQITQQLRQQYFSPAVAAQMAQRDQQVATQQAQVTDYQTDLAALKQEMAASQGRLPATAWQQQYEQRLSALRLKHFP